MYLKYDLIVKKNNPLIKAILESVQILVIFSLVFLIIYFFIGQLLEVTGDSMYPSFYDKEQIIAEKISINTSNIDRGNVVIFKHPIEKNRLLIKRIVGLPGETLSLINGEVHINGERLEEPYLVNGLQTKGQRIIEEGPEYRIPEDSYFVMGDNREKSTDSREWGYVKKELIVGKGILVYYPFNRMRLIKNNYF